MRLAGPGSIPEAGMVNQTIHPSGVSKKVKILKQLGDHSRILRKLKLVSGKMAGVWTMLPLAQTAMRWLPAVRTGDL